MKHDHVRLLKGAVQKMQDYVSIDITQVVSLWVLLRFLLLVYRTPLRVFLLYSVQWMSIIDVVCSFFQFNFSRSVSLCYLFFFQCTFSMYNRYYTSGQD